MTNTYQARFGVFFLIMVLPLVMSFSAAEAQSVTTIVNNGSTASKVDIVFLGDGYTTNDLAQYRTDVQTFTTYFFTQPPFSDYSTFFNVHRVDVVSAEPGADDHCRGIYVNTALDAGYYSTGTDCRALFTYNSTAVRAAASLAPAADITIIIVNSTVYGGAATYGGYGVFYRGGAGPEVMAHEIGHSFGFLADEYNYGGATVYSGAEPSQLNVTINTNLATMKWRDWVLPGTLVPTGGTANDSPGLYEGANYSAFGIYRPTYSSKMQALNRPFERVNYSLLVDRIFDYIPADVTGPVANSVYVAPFSSSRTVNLTGVFSDPESRVMAYKLSESPTFTGAVWELASNQPTFNLNRTWTLSSGDGSKRIYITLKNGYGLSTVSSLVWDVVLDTIPPGAPGMPTAPAAVNPRTFTLSWTASTDVNGIDRYLVYRGIDGSTSRFLIATVTTNSYTESNLAAGIYRYSITAVDRAGLTTLSPVSAAITVASGNLAPVAASQTVTVTEGVARAVTLSATDPEGSALTYRIVSQPLHGALSGTAPNVTYTPAVGYLGSDSFTFLANDGTVDSNTATVSITVQRAPTPVVWTTLVGVSATGNMIRKSAATGWGNGGAVSSAVIPGDGGVDFRADETNTYRMCGLSASNVDANYATINYAIYLVGDGTVQVYESGVLRGVFGRYVTGDRVSVERTGTRVVYKRNGTVFYTSTVASSGNLMVDASIYTLGGTIADVNIRQ